MPSSGGFAYLRSGANRESGAVEPTVEPSAVEPSAADDYPEDGTIPVVKQWVGDDLARAQEAADREDDRPGGARSTLMEYLDALLSDDSDDNDGS